MDGMLDLLFISSREGKSDKNGIKGWLSEGSINRKTFDFRGTKTRSHTTNINDDDNSGWFLIMEAAQLGTQTFILQFNG